MVSQEVQDLLKKHPSLSYDADKQKVICALSKHEMPATTSAIESYLKGKKYKKLAGQQAYDYEKHKPHIVQSNKKKHTHELFCTLTLRHIQKIPVDVERHVNGKRYTRALARWTKCKETGEKFVPRLGGRQPKKVSDSDTDSIEGGEKFFDDEASDDDDDGDDMSDLYPPEDFEIDSDEGGSRANTVPESKADTKQKQKKGGKLKVPEVANGKGDANQEDSDSDYDLSVLDHDDVQPNLDGNGSVNLNNAGDGEKDHSCISDKKLKRKKNNSSNDLIKSEQSSTHSSETSQMKAGKKKTKNKKRKNSGNVSMTSGSVIADGKKKIKLK